VFELSSVGDFPKLPALTPLARIAAASICADEVSGHGHWRF